MISPGVERTFHVSELDGNVLAFVGRVLSDKVGKPPGFLFVPVSALGRTATVLALPLCAQVFWFVDTRSHSVSDTLYGAFPFCVPTLFALAWLADRTGGRTSA